MDKYEEKVQHPDNQDPESLHHALFDHPDSKTWNAVRSLAQPSFLIQIDSYAASGSKPSE